MKRTLIRTAAASAAAIGCSLSFGLGITHGAVQPDPRQTGLRIEGFRSEGFLFGTANGPHPYAGLRPSLPWIPGDRKANWRLRLN